MAANESTPGSFDFLATPLLYAAAVARTFFRNAQLDSAARTPHYNWQLKDVRGPGTGNAAFTPQFGTPVGLYAGGMPYRPWGIIQSGQAFAPKQAYIDGLGGLMHGQAVTQALGGASSSSRNGTAGA